MTDAALAICLTGLGFAVGGFILLGFEPSWLTRWLETPIEEVPVRTSAAGPVSR